MQKSNKSRDAGQAGDYTVGQVSGTLFPEKPQTGALSSLFSTSSSSSGSTLIFVPAPKTDPQATPATSETTVKSDHQISKKKKLSKLISAGEKKLQDRECALQNADDEGQKIKKVKRKRVEADEVETERPIKRKKKNMAEERIKLKRTVFVGNLPPSCSKKDLLCLFSEAGAVETIRFRSVFREDPTMSRKLAAIQRKVHPKKQNINAYVVFREEEAVAGALKWNGWQIQKGFHIRVDRVSQHQAHDHKRSIFVGNLPYDIMELPLRQYFEECGEVQAVRLVRDKDSGIGKGFGYILFESPDSVMLALKLDGSTLLDRKIRVKRSVKKEKVQKVAPGRPSGRKPATGRGNRPSAGGFKGFKQKGQDHPGGRNVQTKASFKGEMTDPAAKKNKGQKKKFKSNKKKNVSYI
ncbi:RNA-binding protein 34 [Triplophysa rosa]|uniref:Rbm34 protein n=1 Tax=Triplophysa rosa TaxID=992332 RepID=A0A9W7WCD8_TRIRA|nr:RNA-binding protein 34 [Triplophysa rosa]KAI7794866.1 Rbm34 protein [Triplophysa rosa]